MFYCTPSANLWIFFGFQLYIGEKERISSFKSSLSLLSITYNQALSDLIKEAKKAYKCEYCFTLPESYSSLRRTEFPIPTFGYEMTCFSHNVGNGFHILFYILLLALPAGSKIEDLIMLASKDLESTTMLFVCLSVCSGYNLTYNLTQLHFWYGSIS